MRLIWSERFVSELRREYEYLRERNPPAAKEVTERIVKSVGRLREFPRSGRAWRLPHAWELVIPGLPYVVIYDLTQDSVVVLAIFHTSRRIPHGH